MRQAFTVGVLLLLPAAMLACTGSAASRAVPAGERGPDELVAHRGAFHERFLLTGELHAVHSIEIGVPRTPSWELPIRWMETDGARVQAGQKIVEFDNSSFASNIEEKRLALAQAENEVERQHATTAAAESEARFQVDSRKNALEKARIDAAVPAELRSAREHQERQLALRRAQMEYDKAVDALDSARKSAREEEAVLKIQRDKARREIQTADSAISALSLSAPRAGILVVGDHPWEGRKLQVGDSVWVGLSVMSIPDLTEMDVLAILSDVDDGRVTSGMRATCTLDTWPERTFAGTVKEVTPVAQEVSRRSQRRGFRARIALDASDAATMRPGMSVKVEIDARTIEDALLVPRAALDLTVDPPHAMLRGGGSNEVRLGPCDAQECVVEQGLEDGTPLRSGGSGT
jgi:multidrug resistance efflux pump